MATNNKPAAAASKASARKKTTKRGPTKAAALKALGLTQDDLDTLKKVALARAEAPLVEPEPENWSAEETGTDERPTGEAVTDEVTSVGPFFARNLRYVDVGIRLDRQSDQKTKRLNFKPRGVRGDLQPLKDEDLDDANLITNVELGVVEIITAGEAKKAIEGQVANAQKAIHPALATLRNELGERYEQTEVTVVGDNSYTVAHLNPQGGEAGAIPSQGRGVDWDAVRNGTTPPGGNQGIISDGFAKPDIAADAVARRKDLEGPGAGGIQSVTITPTEKN